MNNIEKLLKLANFFLREAAKVEPINSVKNPEDLRSMEDIESESFSKYNGGMYISDSEDIEDDLEQPGATGFALRDDDNKLVGYLYGYDFVTDDNWEDIDPDNIKNEWFIDESLYGSEMEEFLQAADSSKVFYISNLAILPKHGSNFLSLILSLKRKLKQDNYKYIVLGALSDSFRLIREGGPGLMRRLGVKPIVRRLEDDQMIYVMKVI